MFVSRHAGGGEQQRGAERTDDPGGLDPPHRVLGLQVVARDPRAGLEPLVVGQLDAPEEGEGHGGGQVHARGEELSDGGVPGAEPRQGGDLRWDGRETQQARSTHYLLRYLFTRGTR